LNPEPCWVQRSANSNDVLLQVNSGISVMLLMQTMACVYTGHCYIDRNYLSLFDLSPNLSIRIGGGMYIYKQITRLDELNKSIN